MKHNPLKLISLNLEGHRHFDLQMPFFRAESPDVLCLQEMLGSDFDFLKTGLGMNGIFAPMCTERRVDREGNEVPDSRGVGMLAKLPLQDAQAHYYLGDQGVMYEFVSDTTPQDQICKVLLTGAVTASEGERFSFGTTHFTWSKGGAADDTQRRDLRALFEKLGAFPDIILCGDFNAPRGQEIFAMIAQRYKDNIPARYTTSIDENLHRHGRIEFMVDGLFSTPEYLAANVRLENGVSDHCAIVAEIARV